MDRATISFTIVLYALLLLLLLQLLLLPLPAAAARSRNVFTGRPTDFSRQKPILEGAIPNSIKAEILAKDQEAANIERIMRKLVDDDGGVHMHMNGDEVGHQKRSTLLGDMRVARVPKAFLKKKKKKTKNTMAPPQDARVPSPPPPPLPHTSLNDVMYHVDYHRATTHTPTNN